MSSSSSDAAAGAGSSRRGGGGADRESGGERAGRGGSGGFDPNEDKNLKFETSKEVDVVSTFEGMVRHTWGWAAAFFHFGVLLMGAPSRRARAGWPALERC